TGSILLDFTSQVCLTPCEAMLSDASRETHQHDRIFTIYSMMVSMGGILGYLLTAIDWTTNSVGAYFGGQEASIFSMLIVIFTMSLTATLMRYLTKLSLMVRARGLSKLIECVKLVLRNIHRFLPNTIQQMLCIPVVLRYLMLANFCAWTAVMGFNLYFTDYVGQIVYKGNPNLPENSVEGHLYDEGVRMGSWACCCTA
ncbi:hypothetical protein BaRGS_00035636, partial [Batillaria attramentaria]